MRNVIANLWNGELSPCENCGKNNAEIENIIELIEIHKESLTNTLSGKSKNAFEKYTSCIEEYQYLITQQAFCDGFGLASKFLAQALTEEH